MAAVVDSKLAGQKVIQMYLNFGLHAVLDYRENEPDHVQIKVGACKKHLPNLERLAQLCNEDNKIDPSKIVKSLNI
jgi:hypothetical protein